MDKGNSLLYRTREFWEVDKFTSSQAWFIISSTLFKCRFYLYITVPYLFAPSGHLFSQCILPVLYVSKREEWSFPEVCKYSSHLILYSQHIVSLFKLWLLLLWSSTTIIHLSTRNERLRVLIQAVWRKN